MMMIMIIIIVIIMVVTNFCLLRLEAAMKTEKESMRSTLDSILAKVNMMGRMMMNMMSTMGRRLVTRWS